MKNISSSNMVQSTYKGINYTYTNEETFLSTGTHYTLHSTSLHSKSDSKHFFGRDLLAIP